MHQLADRPEARLGRGMGWFILGDHSNLLMNLVTPGPFSRLGPPWSLQLMSDGSCTWTGRGSLPVHCASRRETGFPYHVCSHVLLAQAGLSEWPSCTQMHTSRHTYEHKKCRGLDHTRVHLAQCPMSPGGRERRLEGSVMGLSRVLSPSRPLALKV